MRQVVFVCSANKCRSAVSQAIMMGLLKNNQITDVVVNSVGTEDLQEKERDGTMMRIAMGYGYQMDGECTYMNKEILDAADLILVMEYGHMVKVQQLVNYHQYGKIRLFMDYCFGKDVPVNDPSHMPENEYVKTFKLIEEGCKIILKRLKESSRDSDLNF